MPNNRISLDKKDFESLITGGIIRKNDVEICLQDISYVVMATILHDAIACGCK